MPALCVLPCLERPYCRADGNYDDVYPIGSQITVGDGLKVTDIKVKADQILFGYELQDIYDSARRTPMLAY